MAQRRHRRGHHSSGAAAGLTGPAAGACLHAVETRPAAESVWTRRRVLLLNSTYEPLTALPLRRASSC
ncbi:hypothetical protein C1Y40_02057 [Mycobacterium talmoniae]|uniref:Uncharacterized protein n=1 Tax=Mycobacterium talmoniae TaxID=1858794 RepID=A0A2S8BM18_9MYCO|nr:hypothetical protein C1Y40_02057 [Mycobacterium talmoniae]